MRALSYKANDLQGRINALEEKKTCFEPKMEIYRDLFEHEVGTPTPK